MSVPESKRTPKPVFQAALKARELAKYTLTICTNPKNFAPQYQYALTDSIIRTAVAVHVLVHEANNIRVDPSRDGWEDRAARRRQLQEKAASACNTLLAYIDLGKGVYHLRGNRVRYWAKLTIETRGLVQAWKEADAGRFKPDSGM